MRPDYEAMSYEQINARYENGRAVGLDGIIALRDERIALSEALVRSSDATLDVQYGDEPRQRLDFFRTAQAPWSAPTLVFFHGGYWQTSTKEPYRYVAEGPLSKGFNVANVEYRLSPAVSFADVVGDARRALRWLKGAVTGLGGSAQAFYVSGHSAGGHLSVSVSDEDSVSGVVAISGIFDLEPIRLSSVNAKLSLDKETAERFSPMLHIPSDAPPMVIGFGADELDGLRYQSQAFHAALNAASLPATLHEIAGHNHFTILDELAGPQGVLNEALARMRDLTL